MSEQPDKMASGGEAGAVGVMKSCALSDVIKFGNGKARPSTEGDKRLLRQYGYPPDMQLLATETVLKQAEMIASELV